MRTSPDKIGTHGIKAEDVKFPVGGKSHQGRIVPFTHSLTLGCSEAQSAVMWDAVVLCNAPRRLNFTRGFGHVRLLLSEPCILAGWRGSSLACACLPLLTLTNWLRRCLNRRDTRGMTDCYAGTHVNK